MQYTRNTCVVKLSVGRRVSNGNIGDTGSFSAAEACCALEIGPAGLE